MFELSRASARIAVGSGTAVSAGILLLEATGSGASQHHTYKKAQTLMEMLPGIATAARAIVEAALGANPHLTRGMTRKHMPGGLAYHVGHVPECGALACDPGSP